jgi:hypothetical protein
MNSRINEISETIDRATSRSICDAVGERLQQSLRPEALQPSSHLDHLIDELRRRDEENQRRTNRVRPASIAGGAIFGT